MRSGAADGRTPRVIRGGLSQRVSSASGPGDWRHSLTAARRRRNTPVAQRASAPRATEPSGSERASHPRLAQPGRGSCRPRPVLRRSTPCRPGPSRRRPSRQARASAAVKIPPQALTGSAPAVARSDGGDDLRGARGERPAGQTTTAGRHPRVGHRDVLRAGDPVRARVLRGLARIASTPARSSSVANGGTFTKIGVTGARGSDRGHELADVIGAVRPSGVGRARVQLDRVHERREEVERGARRPRAASSASETQREVVRGRRASAAATACRAGVRQPHRVHERARRWGRARSAAAGSPAAARA